MILGPDMGLTFDNRLCTSLKFLFHPILKQLNFLLILFLVDIMNLSQLKLDFIIVIISGHEYVLLLYQFKVLLCHLPQLLLQDVYY
jgi:hypothetical protein